MEPNELFFQRIGLKALKTIVVLLLFFGVSFILNVSSAKSINAIQKISENNQKTDEILKMIEN